MGPDIYALNISYQLSKQSLQRYFDCSEQAYRCKWTILGDYTKSQIAEGYTDIVEAIGIRDEVIEFTSSVDIPHNYDDDFTLRFEIFCASRPSSMHSMLDSRRASDNFVRFRNFSANLLWKSVDSIDCDLNAIVHRGRFSESDENRNRKNSSGKFMIISESSCKPRNSIIYPEIRMDVSVSQLEKRGMMKHTDVEAFLTMHRKSLTREEYIIVHRSPRIIASTSSSIHKFPEVVISKEKLLGGADDRIIRFTLRSAISGEIIGEAEVPYSEISLEGKVNIKLHTIDFNGNTLFGSSSKNPHHVGVLHIILFTEGRLMSTSSRGSSTSSSNSYDERTQRSNKDDEEMNVKDMNVIIANGRTQAYLISLLAPTMEIRLRQPHHSASDFFDGCF